MDRGRRQRLLSLPDLLPMRPRPNEPDPEPLPPPPVHFNAPGIDDTALDSPQALREAAGHQAEITVADDEPADGAPGEVTATSPLSDILSHRTVGDRYEIEEPIGEGGMGRVLRVRHLQLDKRFALKLMRTDFAGDARSREQFFREARLASSISHPNIVSVVDFGEDGRLGAFMVMELLDGEPISSRLRSEGRFPLRLACEVILQIAEALHAIHGRHIVHSDIKPDNILMCRLPGTDRRRWEVKLLDFGLARVRSASPRLSMLISGTPEYMAPERIRGLSPQPSMDIYSLGVLAYELMTGKLPFGGSLAKVMEAHVKQPPPPFATHVEPGTIDERAEALVMRALAKDPAARQKDMAAFIYELRTLMDMLGFGRRRRSVTESRIVARSARVDQAAACFEASPIPIGGLSAEGRIVVANSAFARFLTGDRTARVEGMTVGGTKLVDIYPRIGADLQRIGEGTPLQTVLRLEDADRRPVTLVVWLARGTDTCPIVLSVHRLELE